MTRRVVVIGAGIVGTAVAERLGAHGGCAVTVLDQAATEQLRGSTGHAPGFVGLAGEDPLLVELARASVGVYRRLGWRGRAGFEAVGAVELAASPAGADLLARRAELAAAAGIPAVLLDPEDAVKLAPRAVDADRAVGALHLPLDGAADATAVTAALRARAVAAGARFAACSKVTGIDVRAGRVAAVRAGSGVAPADDVVVAAGIWGPAVARLAGVELPLVAAAHPYVYGPRRPVPHQPSPLVRWPEHGVYTRDHGDRDGLGTSGHEPLVAPEPPPERADLPWPGGALEDAVIAGISLWPAQHRWQPAERVAGLLCVTPDGRPLLGPLPEVEGLWAAESLWVTHASGAARALVATMFGEPAPVDALAPSRFAGESLAKLLATAAAQYGSGTTPVNTFHPQARSAQVQGGPGWRDDG